MNSSVGKSSPFSLPNIRLFIALRVLFNCRFYYPVFTILFLDFGLSIEQFALLNTVWALTIVLSEVPSGALADVVGRKYLLVATAVLMFMEMLLIAFVPLGNGSLIFWAFLLNRVLSGLAEAMASGADEALAYDTLVEEGNPDDWPKVLDIQMRAKSLGTVITMIVGALVYDPQVVNSVIHWLGLETEVSQQMSMRYPIYLTLLLSLGALLSSLMMKDPVPLRHISEAENSFFSTLWQAGRKTWQAGGWIVGNPFALAVILFGMGYDHVLRMIVTMTSQYFRLIDLPEASFGLIGAVFASLGFVVPKLAREMVRRNSPLRNAIYLGTITLVALWSLTAFVPYLGLLPMALVYCGMMLTSFFTSHYLNRITESHQRATVLSFKGLAFNLAYGVIGVLFAALMQELRRSGAISRPDLSMPLVEGQAFRDAIAWFPWYTLSILGLIVCFSAWSLRKSEVHRKLG
ncbi:MAG: MFS transporter [Proteobacteria bacterium]|nr:MFS transporter [Pseudomonadota bacterium]MBU1060062.1 MFS transporter [Pseudomonadota bacterium]